MKIFLSVLFLLWLPLLALADEYTPPISCDDFLRDPILKEQLFEIFGEASYEVNKVQDKIGGHHCTLRVKTWEGKTYFFSSQSHVDFIYDKQTKTVALLLFQDNNPKYENVLEGTYDEHNREEKLIDAAYDFHLHDVKKHSRYKGIHPKIKAKNAS